MTNLKEKTKKLEIETYLPIFPGFYNTIFDTESFEENEIDDINQQRTAKGLKEISWDDCKWDYNEYRDNVVRGSVDWVEEQINSTFKNKCKVTFQQLRSPREYNFANDAVDIKVEFSEKLLTEIKNYLVENYEDFSTYLERYKSYDGFSSFYEHDIEHWLEVYFEQMETDKHILGSILEFIIENEFKDEMEGAQLDLYYSIPDLFLGASNYHELIGE